MFTRNMFFKEEPENQDLDQPAMKRSRHSASTKSDQDPTGLSDTESQHSPASSMDYDQQVIFFVFFSSTK